MKTTVVTAAFATLATSVVLVAGAGQKAQKAGKVTITNYPAKLVFLDRTDDAITSDGKGAYQDGIDGVTAEFQVSSDGSNPQFLLEFGAVRGKMPRSISYSYSTPVTTSCNPTPSSDPVGTVSDTGYVDFLNIGTMPLGAVMAKQGGFHTSVGTFRFADATKFDPVNPYHCGDLLVVTRNSATTWTVTTDVVPGQTYFNTAGTPVYTANPEEVGSTSQLDNDSTTAAIGNYRSAFFATITCLSASKCPSGS